MSTLNLAYHDIHQSHAKLIKIYILCFYENRVMTSVLFYSFSLISLQFLVVVARLFGDYCISPNFLLCLLEVVGLGFDKKV